MTLSSQFSPEGQEYIYLQDGKASLLEQEKKKKENVIKVEIHEWIF